MYKYDPNSVSVVLMMLMGITLVSIHFPWLNPLATCIINSKSGRAAAEIDDFVIATHCVYFSEFGKLLFPTNMVGMVSTSAFLPVLLGTGITPESQRINPTQFRHISIGKDRIKSDEYIDPWGKPYHFLFNTQKQVVKTDEGVILSKHFYMWSDGPNGINEWGEGDDICNWKSPHDKTWWRVLLGKTGKKFLDNFDL